MNKIVKALNNLLLIPIVGMVTIVSCGTNPDSPGVEYMPDMYRSPTIEPYVDYAQVRNVENYENQSYDLSAKKPPLGTIPNYGSNFEINLPFEYYPSKNFIETHGLELVRYDENGYEKSAKALNPILLYSGNAKSILKEGKALYKNNCMHCHGEKGEGKGSIVKSGAYSGVPNYKTLDIKPGQMMFSITYGKGQMGAHMNQLTPSERWKLVHYVEALQNNGKPKLNCNIGIDVSDTLNISKKPVVLKDIYFSFGGSKINYKRKNSSLYALLNFMTLNSKFNIELSGHTDNIGNPEANLILSRKRANSVKEFLIENGVDSDRIYVVGYGLTKPIATNSTEEGRAINRRTEVSILK